MKHFTQFVALLTLLASTAFGQISTTTGLWACGVKVTGGLAFDEATFSVGPNGWLGNGLTTTTPLPSGTMATSAVQFSIDQWSSGGAVTNITGYSGDHTSGVFARGAISGFNQPDGFYKGTRDIGGVVASWLRVRPAQASSKGMGINGDAFAEFKFDISDAVTNNLFSADNLELVLAFESAFRDEYSPSSNNTSLTVAWSFSFDGISFFELEKKSGSFPPTGGTLGEFDDWNLSKTLMLETASIPTQTDYFYLRAAIVGLGTPLPFSKLQKADSYWIKSVNVTIRETCGIALTLYNVGYSIPSVCLLLPDDFKEDNPYHSGNGVYQFTVTLNADIEADPVYTAQVRAADESTSWFTLKTGIAMDCIFGAADAASVNACQLFDTEYYSSILLEQFYVTRVLKFYDPAFGGSWVEAMGLANVPLDFRILNHGEPVDIYDNGIFYLEMEDVASTIANNECYLSKPAGPYNYIAAQ